MWLRPHSTVKRAIREIQKMANVMEGIEANIQNSLGKSLVKKVFYFRTTFQVKNVLEPFRTYYDVWPLVYICYDPPYSQEDQGGQ